MIIHFQNFFAFPFGYKLYRSVSRNQNFIFEIHFVIVSWFPDYFIQLIITQFFSFRKVMKSCMN